MSQYKVIGAFLDTDNNVVNPSDIPYSLLDKEKADRLIKAECLELLTETLKTKGRPKKAIEEE